jgi:hypothetical protein
MLALDIVISLLSMAYLISGSREEARWLRLLKVNGSIVAGVCLVASLVVPWPVSAVLLIVAAAIVWTGVTVEVVLKRRNRS